MGAQAGLINCSSRSFMPRPVACWQCSHRPFDQPIPLEHESGERACSLSSCCTTDGCRLACRPPRMHLGASPNQSWWFRCWAATSIKYTAAAAAAAAAALLPVSSCPSPQATLKNSIPAVVSDDPECGNDMTAVCTTHLQERRSSSSSSSSNANKMMAAPGAPSPSPPAMPVAGDMLPWTSAAT